MKVVKVGVLETINAVILALIFIITRYYHSFFVNAQGYGSGDAYGVILNAYNIESNNDNYLVSFFYKLSHELTHIPYTQLSFYVTPIIGMLIILLMFNIIKKKFGLLTATLASIILTLNPWLAYNSTEPSKEIYVLAFFILSIYCLIRFDDLRNKKWLVNSFFFFSIGILFYHSILLFLPFYIVLVFIILRQHNDKKTSFSFVKYITIFVLMSITIAGPPYAIREVKQREILSRKPKVLISDVDQQGNIFQRQIGAMVYALEKDNSKLGFTNLSSGIKNYISNNSAYIYLFFLSFLISSYLSYKKISHVPLLFCALTIYIYIVLGVQFTSYSHGSRYPQYVLYFFLISISLPISWSLKLLKSLSLKVLSMMLLFIAIFHLSNPFQKVDSYRNIYLPQRSIGSTAKKVGVKINKESQIIYIGWPSTTMSLLEKYKLHDTNYFNTFGWGSVNLKGIASKDFIINNNIKYFIYDTNGADYFNSNEQVFIYLKRNFNLRPLTSKYNNSIVIYQIERS